MKLKNAILLLLTAAIWGVAFVAQSVGMDYVEPYTFNAVRCLIGGVVLIPVIFLLDRWENQRPGGGSEGKTAAGKRFCEKTAAERAKERKILIQGGICCGVMLCLASNFQQFGVKYTTVGKAGFITACYIVIVPVLGLFLKKKCGPAIWGAVALAVAGLYLLCMEGDGFSVSKGDFFVFICAILFSLHIMVIDYFSPMVDGVKLSCIQFFVAGILSSAAMFLFEHPAMENILAAWMPILYAGIMSCGVAYTLQIVGQKGMNPTISSLILSLESSISVLAGWVILGQKLSGRQLAGCVIMFGAIVLAQLPGASKSGCHFLPHFPDRFWLKIRQK